MALDSANQHQIETAIERARGRWLLSAMVNAGGRWAVLPAGLVALVGIVLALAEVTSPAVLLPVVGLGLAGVAAALLLTRREFAKSASAGAPDWTLLLDRALGLNDALPAYIEGKGDFRAMLEVPIVAALDPAKERAAAPKRHFAPLAVALVLALFPLVAWLPERETPSADEVAETAPQAQAPVPQNSQPQPNAGGGDDAEDAPGESGSMGGGGGEGEVQKRPDGAKTEGGAGQPPEDVKPQPLKGNPPPKEGGIGNNDTPPTDVPKPEDTEVKTDITKIKPVAGDGDTCTENRSRWVYDPDGDSTAEATPAGPRRGEERAMPRTKLTSSERARLEAIYRKLYE